MGATPVRVVIAEDETLIRRGLELVLAGGAFDIVRTVSTAPALVAAVEEAEPDLVLTDIRMPPGYADEGLTAALEIRRVRPGLPICVLSQHVLAGRARTLFEAGGPVGSPAGDPAGSGGLGYLLKQRITRIDEFLADLHRIVAGEIVIDPEVVEKLLGRPRSAGRAADPIARLTGRQREVLALLAEGRSNAAIAEQLSITEKAVVYHISNIYSALGLLDEDSHRRVQAVLRYLFGP